jgi:hypothetical protein
VPSIRYAYFAMAAGFAMSSCAQYQPRPLSPDPAALDFKTRRLDDAGLKKYLEQNHVEVPRENAPSLNY